MLTTLVVLDPQSHGPGYYVLLAHNGLSLATSGPTLLYSIDSRDAGRAEKRKCRQRKDI